MIHDLSVELVLTAHRLNFWMKVWTLCDRTVILSSFLFVATYRRRTARYVLGLKPSPAQLAVAISPGVVWNGLIVRNVFSLSPFRNFQKHYFYFNVFYFVCVWFDLKYVCFGLAFSKRISLHVHILKKTHACMFALWVWSHYSDQQCGKSIFLLSEDSSSKISSIHLPA